MHGSRSKGRLHPAWSLLALSALAAGTADVARPSCGLENCPVVRPAPAVASSEFTLQLLVREGSYDLEGERGDYTQMDLRLEALRSRRWGFGAYLPLVNLRAEDSDSVFGLGNLVVFGETRLHPDPRLELSLGSQLEMPLGNHEDRIAADHFELLPYVRARWEPGRSFVHASLGLRAAIGGEEEAIDEDEHEDDAASDAKHGPELHGGEAGAESLVFPHEDRELLWRLTAGRTYGRAAPQLYLDAQHVLSGEDPGQAFVSLGFSVPFSVGSRYRLVPNLEVPLTSDARFEWRTGLGFVTNF